MNSNQKAYSQDQISPDLNSNCHTKPSAVF